MQFLWNFWATADSILQAYCAFDKYVNYEKILFTNSIVFNVPLSHCSPWGRCCCFNDLLASIWLLRVEQMSYLWHNSVVCFSNAVFFDLWSLTWQKCSLNTRVTVVPKTGLTLIGVVFSLNECFKHLLNVAVNEMESCKWVFVLFTVWNIMLGRTIGHALDHLSQTSGYSVAVLPWRMLHTFCIWILAHSLKATHSVHEDF